LVPQRINICETSSLCVLQAQSLFWAVGHNGKWSIQI
jgi:hypothetical protein